jgi:hypothetical protein
VCAVELAVAGVTVSGAAFSEPRLIALAYALEQAHITGIWKFGVVNSESRQSVRLLNWEFSIFAALFRRWNTA